MGVCKMFKLELAQSNYSSVNLINAAKSETGN